MHKLFEILARVVASRRTVTPKGDCTMPKTHTATFTIHIDPSATEIGFSPDGGALAPGKVGVDVSDELVTVVDGGTRPYHATVSGGALPPGLTLAQGTSSIVLQGAPTTPGDFTFDVTVTDSGA